MATQRRLPRCCLPKARSPSSTSRMGRMVARRSTPRPGMGMRPQLFEAACEGDAAKVGTLLSTHAAQSFINYQHANGAAPLHWVVRKGHAAVTKQLIAARCNVDLQMEDSSTQLFVAAEYGHDCRSALKRTVTLMYRIFLVPRNGYSTAG